MSERPNLGGPRPAPLAGQGQDPVDTPSYVTGPEPKVLVQFRFSAAERDAMHALQRRRGDRNLIDTQRWLVHVVIPRIMDGSAGIDVNERGTQG